MFHGLTIREYINENINQDTDYWYLNIGSHYILTYLLKYSDKDWIRLKEDILRWEEEEIEILAISLAYKDQFPAEANQILRQRFELFSHIFYNVSTALAYELLDELLEFLNLEVLEFDRCSLHRIQNQFNSISVLYKNEHQSQWFSKIQDKINSKIIE